MFGLFKKKVADQQLIIRAHAARANGRACDESIVLSAIAAYEENPSRSTEDALIKIVVSVESVLELRK